MPNLIPQLEAVARKFAALTERLADPAGLADRAAYQQAAKAHAELQPIVDQFAEYQRLCRELDEARLILRETIDPDLRGLAEAEIGTLTARVAACERELQLLLLPRDAADERSVLLEIRAGAGGEEAGLFAAELLRMYGRYAEAQGWRVELLSSSPTGIGGIKEAILGLEGRGAYRQLKYESGVHRVQRVPATEASGRIHTSTVTVAVLPEAEEVEVEVNPRELRIDVFRSTGPGGQSVNTTDSAVRITHLPTGLVVTCQDEKSQHKNKAKAMKVLRARLLERARAEQQAKIDAERSGQVGSGERAEKIRTYNFPQNRVTDHRVGLTLHNLSGVLGGELADLIAALAAHDQAERLRAAV
jgi:peptide chain release factor 1